MYVTTVASILVTAYNLYFNVYVSNLAAGRMVPVIGSGLMVVVALLLVAAALLIGVDGCRAFVKYSRRASRAPETAAVGG
jgi:succinate dehydrogenase hydrophobic anchor subunit